VKRAAGEISDAPESRELRALPNLADLPDGELMRALEAHGAEVRAVLARAAALSQELAKRSAKSLGRDALSKRAGYSNSTIAAAHLFVQLRAAAALGWRGHLDPDHVAGRGAPAAIRARR
jgi:hypothetical protein